MEKHIVKVLQTNFVTHNVKHFVIEKPAGYTFVSGQATDVSINRPGLEDELRPFTFTSLNHWDNLEFTIKIYTDHDGVTNKLLSVNAGDELIIHEVFGAIEFKEPGLFIAGGAGVTPFISILRQLNVQNNLKGSILLFANHTEADIILHHELSVMLGDNLINVISHPNDGTKGEIINKAMLSRYVNKETANYYVCGPDQFIEQMINDLKELGVKEDQIIYEH
ncbi:flavodoxin reductase [Mucilaginibacter sp. AW1-3]